VDGKSFSRAASSDNEVELRLEVDSLFLIEGLLECFLLIFLFSLDVKKEIIFS